jgi:O-antigen/teichoic acid export membrane protein
MGIVAKQASKASIAIGLGMVFGAINTMYVLPRVFEGHEDQWGLVRVLTAWGAMASHIVALGVPSSIIRFLPQYPEEERPGILGSLLVFPLVGIALMGLLLAWGGPWLFRRFGGEDGETLSAHLGFLFALTAIPAAMWITRAVINTALKSALATAVEELWLKASYMGLALLLGMHFFDFDTFMYLYVGTWGAGVALLLWQAQRNRMRVGWPVRHAPWREYLTYSSYNVLAIGAVAIAQNLDFIMVGAYLGLDSVPKYTMGFFLGTVVAMPVRATGQVLSGLTSIRMTQAPVAELKGLLQQSSRINFLLSVACMAGIWAGFAPFEQLLPEHYRGIAPIFLAIGFQRLIIASSGNSSAILSFSGLYREALPIQLGLVVLTVITNHIAMKTLGWGLTGAAIATCITAVWGSAWGVHRIWKHFRIQPLTWDLLHIVCFGGALAWLGSLPPLGWSQGYPLVEAGVQGAVTSGAILWVAYVLGYLPEVRGMKLGPIKL